MSRRGDYIQTGYLGQFWPFDPRPEDFHIEDISHALSNLCRFGGHSPGFYSVAQHSVLCAQVAPDHLKFEALMHDRSEAYLVDVPRPIKYALANYKDLEAVLDEVSAKTFGLSPTMLPEIREIDNRILATEGAQFFAHYDVKWWLEMGVEPYADMVIEPWSPADAKAAFMTAYEAYRA